MHIAVEQVAGDEQPHILRAMRKAPVDEHRDQEEDDEVETVENHRSNRASFAAKRSSRAGFASQRSARIARCHAKTNCSGTHYLPKALWRISLALFHGDRRSRRGR